MSASAALPQLLERFFRIVLVERQDASHNTIHAYRDARVLLLRFAARRAGCDVARLELGHLGREAFLAFLEDLERSRGNSVRTRNARLAAVHSFLRFIAEEDPASLVQAQSILNIPFKRGTQACIASIVKRSKLCSPPRIVPVPAAGGMPHCSASSITPARVPRKSSTYGSPPLGSIHRPRSVFLARVVKSESVHFGRRRSLCCAPCFATEGLPRRAMNRCS